MSNFMLNGISGDIKGGMLDQKLLFDNENQWQKLELSSNVEKGDAFAKIDADSNLHITGYVKFDQATTKDSLGVLTLPDSFPKSFEKGTSNITDVPNPMPIWYRSNTVYDYLDMTYCWVTSGLVEIFITHISPGIIIFPDVVLKPTL